MTINKSNSIISTILLVLIVAMIIIAGPVNALNISITPSKNTAEYEEVIDFLINIEMETFEKIPIKNISSYIVDKDDNIISSCYFDINGNKLTSCDDFIDINKITDETTYSYSDNLEAQAQNDIITFGYGYGYSTNETPAIKYNISWKTPDFTNIDNEYKILIKVNAQNLNNLYTFEAENIPTIDIINNKPTAILEKNNFDILEGNKIFINASNSYDPDNFNITYYRIYEENNLLYESNQSQFEILLNKGDYDLTFAVVNDKNIESLRIPLNIIIYNNFESQSFKLEANDLIENSNINFQITSYEEFNSKYVKIKPTINCLNINFKYNKEYLDKELKLTDPNTYNFNIDINDFHLNIPTQNNCILKLDLIDENGDVVTLEENVKFEKKDQNFKEEVYTLNNGNDLTNYVANSFSQEFNKGFNSVKFALKNDGNQNLKAEFKVTINDLNYAYDQDITISPNSQSNVMFPLHIDDKIKPGRYPMRISYRLNEGDLRVKYSYLVIS